uniref:Uncharacterized protein n=1 Tax=Strigamia maritima TaxID=126957 RepID=T1IZC3_STRMM
MNSADSRSKSATSAPAEYFQSDSCSPSVRENLISAGKLLSLTTVLRPTRSSDTRPRHKKLAKCRKGLPGLRDAHNLNERHAGSMAGVSLYLAVSNLLHIDKISKFKAEMDNGLEIPTIPLVLPKFVPVSSLRLIVQGLLMRFSIIESTVNDWDIDNMVFGSPKPTGGQNLIQSSVGHVYDCGLLTSCKNTSLQLLWDLLCNIRNNLC